MKSAVVPQLIRSLVAFYTRTLKDKTLAHLDLLVLRGVIKGSPLVLPDDHELPYLREFINRHNAGIPHNPRLRGTLPDKQMPDTGKLNQHIS